MLTGKMLDPYLGSGGTTVDLSNLGASVSRISNGRPPTSIDFTRNAFIASL